MKIIYTLLFAFFTNFLMAQNGYKIVVKTSQIDHDILYLKIYNGTYNSNFKIDSATIDSNNRTVTFIQPKKIIGSIFRLELKSDPKSKTDILIENNSYPNFTLEGNNLLTLSTESQPNKDFMAYQRLQVNSEEKLKSLQSLQKKYPSSALNLFTSLEQKRIEKTPEDLVAAKILARNQFFKGIDLNSRQIKLMPNMFQVLYKYITILPVDNDNYKENIDVLLKGQNCDSTNFVFYLGWVFKNLEYYSKKNMNESFNYVFNKYLNDEKCINANKNFYNQNLAKLNSLEAVPVGTTIPEIAMQDSEDKTYSLSERYSKSKYTFIMFFDPDCSHCKEQAPKVAEYFSALKKQGIEVQTISFLNTVNQKDWKIFTDDYLKNGWLNVKSKDNKADYLEKLQTYSNPNFFLLDQNGKVLLKTFSEQQINKLVLESK